jgi:hypothetical protein
MRYAFAECILDTRLYTLHRQGTTVRLRPKASQVLQYLPSNIATTWSPKTSSARTCGLASSSVMRRSKAASPWPAGPLAITGGCNGSSKAVGAMAIALWGACRKRP